MLCTVNRPGGAPPRLHAHQPTTGRPRPPAELLSALHAREAEMSITVEPELEAFMKAKVRQLLTCGQPNSCGSSGRHHHTRQLQRPLRLGLPADPLAAAACGWKLPANPPRCLPPSLCPAPRRRLAAGTACRWS